MRVRMKVVFMQVKVKAVDRASEERAEIHAVSITKEIKDAINNIYYRYGYTTDEYTSLTDNIINSRRYFNYVKGDINIATSVSLEKDRYISQDAIADVLERFKSGVTILHTLINLMIPENPVDVDCLKFEYENWEDFIAYGGIF